MCLNYLLKGERLWGMSLSEIKPLKIQLKEKIFMPSFIFSKTAQWAGLQFFLGQFLPPNLMFDTPFLKGFCNTEPADNCYLL